ncbi:conserved hypothetical protein [Magnetospirillum sp. SS-4]|nr:conserved hypothetical protein [Magnetospirillum sp. SS-4]
MERQPRPSRGRHPAPRPVRADPPEDCPVKDRCRRARAALCRDCGASRPPRKAGGSDRPRQMS